MSFFGIILDFCISFRRHGAQFRVVLEISFMIVQERDRFRVFKVERLDLGVTLFGCDSGNSTFRCESVALAVFVYQSWV